MLGELSRRVLVVVVVVVVLVVSLRPVVSRVRRRLRRMRGLSLLLRVLSRATRASSVDEPLAYSRGVKSVLRRESEWSADCVSQEIFSLLVLRCSFDVGGG